MLIFVVLTNMYNKVTRVSAVQLSAAEVAKHLLKLPNWKYDGKKITREFVLKDFETTWAFLSQVAMRSHLYGHHPTIQTTYNKVRLDLSTHDIQGVSEIDLKLAKKVEGYAAGKEKVEGRESNK